jgi:hypothetical protein
MMARTWPTLFGRFSRLTASLQRCDFSQGSRSRAIIDLQHFQVIAIVSDNAQNNDTMMDKLEILYRAAGIPFLRQWARIRCIPHVLHLSATKVVLWRPVLDVCAHMLPRFSSPSMLFRLKRLKQQPPLIRTLSARAQHL